MGAAGIERPTAPTRVRVLHGRGRDEGRGESRPFDRGLLDVVALGGDTDTNAAVAGALLGAMHGTEALPAAWLAAPAGSVRDRGGGAGAGSARVQRVCYD